MHAGRRGVTSELSGYLAGLLDSVYGEALLWDTLSTCKEGDDDYIPKSWMIFFFFFFLGSSSVSVEGEGFD